MALSIISSGVTQTGQPGPWTSSTELGIKSSMPYRINVCVCPPQTSIRTQGRVARRAIFFARAMAISPISVFVYIFHALRSECWEPAVRFRRSLRSFRAKLFLQQAHFLQEQEGALGLFLIHTGDCKSHVNQHVVADRGFGHEIEANLTHDSAEINATVANCHSD